MKGHTRSTALRLCRGLRRGSQPVPPMAAIRRRILARGCPGRWTRRAGQSYARERGTDTPLCGARLHQARDRADPGSDCRRSEADPGSPVAGVLPPGRLGQARRRVAGHDGALRAAGDASRRADRPAAATTPAPCARTGRLRAGERTTAAAVARDPRGGAAAQPRPRPRPDQPPTPCCGSSLSRATTISATSRWPVPRCAIPWSTATASRSP